MAKTSIIGLDLAKRVFQAAHGARADGGVAFRHKLSREKVLAFLALKPRCVVVMEACGNAHHFGRAIRDLGHEVCLIPPSYVKPFAKRQKNDAADAEAIAEAASRPAMRFVAVKTQEQQARAMLFRTRDVRVGSHFFADLLRALAFSGQKPKSVQSTIWRPDALPAPSNVPNHTDRAKLERCVSSNP